MATAEMVEEVRRRIDIAARKKSEKLDLSGLDLRHWPAELETSALPSRLSTLKRIDLDHNALTVLPAWICELPRLEVLHAGFNRLSQVPADLAKLTKLQLLALEHNQLRSLPQTLCALSSLKRLDLTANYLAALPDCIRSMRALGGLYLSQNRLMEMPEWTCELVELRALHLGANSLRRLPEGLGKLTHLQEMYLESNELTELPASMHKILGLKSFSIADGTGYMGWDASPYTGALQLKDNPLNPELEAALEDGMSSLMAYLSGLAQSVPLNEAKLVLIGEGEVGKSSLLAALRGEPWVEGRLTTHGIEVKKVEITLDDGRTLDLNCWDFGGQPIYRATHQLFFSAPAIYVVVWKPREGPDQGFVDYWIRLIKHRAGSDVRIMVVATHGGPKERQPHIDEATIRNTYGAMICGFYHVDSKSGVEIARLKTDLGKVAQELPHIGRKYPLVWKRVREALRALREPFLTYDAFCTLCHERGLEEDQTAAFASVSNTTGHLIHYGEDPGVSNIVVLKGDWLSTAISFVLEDKVTLDQNGLISHVRLREIWNDPSRPPEARYDDWLHPVFLRLMERFDLSYRISSDALDGTQGEASLIAQLVPSERPNIPPAWSNPAHGETTHVNVCKIIDGETGFSARAEGILYQLIVRLHRYSLGRRNFADSRHWQKGVLLDDGYHGRAMVELEGNNIRISAFAAYPVLLMHTITEEIRWLVARFWKGLTCEIMVPCAEPCGRGQPGTGLFSVEKLMTSRSRGESFPCSMPNCSEWQSIDRLLLNARTPEPIIVDADKVLSRLKEGHDQIVALVRDGTTILSAQLGKAMSQVDAHFIALMTSLNDEARDGPRLFSIEPLEPTFFDQPKWLSQKMRITLWCEHSRLPVRLLDPKQPNAGVYDIVVPRQWLEAVAPYVRFIATTLSLAIPIAPIAAQVLMEPAEHKQLASQLERVEKAFGALEKSGTRAARFLRRKDASTTPREVSTDRQGMSLRIVHTLLKQHDPDFGGLVRVQNRRYEYLWVHRRYVTEYYPEPPVF
jgi:Leucine-rich repeat (LRR) protein